MPKKKKEKIFRLSEKVTLREGDKIRVSSGPYYLTQSGEKIRMGESGVGYFVDADEDGRILYIRFGNGINSLIRVVYIGEKYTSEMGTVMKPHKITKMRKKT